MAKASSTQQVNEQWLSQACPFSVTLSALGHRWRAPILWKLLRGDRTFADLLRSLPLVTEKMLAQELKRLQGLGLVAKQGVARQPLRTEYLPTDRGRSLDPILAAMYTWGEVQQGLASNTAQATGDAQR